MKRLDAAGLAPLATAIPMLFALVCLLIVAHELAKAFPSN